MISDVLQPDDVDSSAAVSNDTIAGSSANGAWDSAQTVSHAMQDVALKASDSPMIGSSEMDKTPMEFKLQDTVSSPHFAVPEGRIFLDICSGTTRPLSVAVLALGCDVLSFDILLDESMDLLRDDSYEQLLRLNLFIRTGWLWICFSSLLPLFSIETSSWSRPKSVPYT